METVTKVALSNRYTGKLLLRSEIPLENTHFQELLNAAYFTPTPSIIKTLFNDQCTRCGNQKRSLFGIIPCQSCGETHSYCRKCIDMGRVMTCEPLYEWTGPRGSWPALINACSWKGKLTDNQQKAADRIIETINAGKSELLVWAVCGAGKTEMLFPGITEALAHGYRICVATPRTDVVRELLPRFKEAFSDVTVEGLYGGSEDKDGSSQLILATTHQLLRFKQAFNVVIIDEVDAFPYTKDLTLPFAVNRAKKEASTTIYLTATPRHEHKTQIARNKLPHVFVPKRFHGYPLPVPVLKMCFSLKKDLQKSMPPASFFKWFDNREKTSRQLLVFVPTISLAEKISEALEASNDDQRVMAVHASDADREEKIQQFRRKQFDILVTTTILERGVTFPAVDVVVLDSGHTVFDEAALVQIAGRAGRSPDDPTGEVIFFHNGKTDAMVQSVELIKKMNRRGRVD